MLIFNGGLLFVEMLCKFWVTHSIFGTMSTRIPKRFGSVHEIKFIVRVRGSFHPFDVVYDLTGHHGPFDWMFDSVSEAVIICRLFQSVLNIVNHMVKKL